MRARATEAAGAAQAVLRTVAPWLQIDGQWGKTTQDVFTKAPAEVQARVNAVLRALEWTPEQLVQYREKQREAEWIDVIEAEKLVLKAAGLYGLSAYAEAFKDFLRREAVKAGGRYKITSRNGSSTGLMQMQPAAWADAMKVASKIAPGSLSNFVDGVYDAEQNIRAGIAYAMVNIRQLTASGIPITGETLYLAHNQGAAGAIKLMKQGAVNAKNFAGQSGEVKDLIMQFKGKYATAK